MSLSFYSSSCILKVRMQPSTYQTYIMFVVSKAVYFGFRYEKGQFVGAVIMLSVFLERSISEALLLKKHT